MYVNKVMNNNKKNRKICRLCKNVSIKNHAGKQINKYEKPVGCFLSYIHVVNKFMNLHTCK
jgi:hypothetical protein